MVLLAPRSSQGLPGESKGIPRDLPMVGLLMGEVMTVPFNFNQNLFLDTDTQATDHHPCIADNYLFLTLPPHPIQTVASCMN